MKCCSASIMADRAEPGLDRLRVDAEHRQRAERDRDEAQEPQHAFALAAAKLPISTVFVARMGGA